jgi:hypothetical protein
LGRAALRTWGERIDSALVSFACTSIDVNAGRLEASTGLGGWDGKGFGKGKVNMGGYYIYITD